MINPITKSTVVLLSLILMLSFYLIIITEYGLLDLQRFKKEKKSLIIKNSIIGLEILGQIDVFKRLAKNDLKLIEHIARSELQMVGKNELILIPTDSQKSSIENQGGNNPNNFRILTEDEIGELLSFDINSFKFHDKLKDNTESPQDDGSRIKQNKKGHDIFPEPQANLPETSGIAKAPNKVETEKKLSGSKKITIQVGAFRNRKNAENLTKKLKEKGYSASLVVSTGSENSAWYKVKVGNLDDINEANLVLRALKKDGFKPIIVRKAKQNG